MGTGNEEGVLREREKDPSDAHLLLQGKEDRKEERYVRVDGLWFSL